MRITCPHCGDNTIVSHVINIDPTVKEVLCNCKNPSCQSRTKHIVSHTADIVLPIKKRKTITLEQIISQLPEADQRRLAKTFG